MAKLILCISLVHVIGKPLYTINDCASYFVFVFPLAFLSPFLLVTRFCLENFVTIVRKTSLHIQMVKIVSYFLFIVSLCLVVWGVKGSMQHYSRSLVLTCEISHFFTMLVYGKVHLCHGISV